ncbi:MAG: ComF family protein [Erythrobacter sp.]|nr:ComF family protein [Erythrobacter sp.]RZV31663.1 MAG: ComF family protein [Sphingomonadaceae bacterium]
MKPLRLLRDSFAPVVDLVYPPRCPLCGSAIEQPSGLCVICWEGLVIPSEPSCTKCQRPLPSQSRQKFDEPAICAPCLAHPPRHAGIAAATLYNDTSRQLVLRFKHGGRIALAGMMARLMAGRLGELEEDTVIVPVPLHRWRLWRRGYNQAALLARELAISKGSKLVLDALVRTKATPSLGGLGKKARKRALANAIAVNLRARDKIAGRSVILVDDVLTSGTTSHACVQALLKAGAREVRIACFARVLDESLPQGAARPTNETPEAAKTPGAT